MKKRKRWWRATLLMSLGMAVAGCTDGEPGGIRVPQAVVASGYKEKLLGAQEVVDRLSAEGIPMNRNKDGRYIRLNNIHPIVLELPNQETLYVYLYDSERSVKLARDDFAKQTKLQDTVRPIVYDVKNIMILYAHRTPGDNPRRMTAYNDAIDQAIERLLGDEVQLKLSDSYNVGKLDMFMESVRQGKADQLKVTAFTIEGDPIFTYGVWNGSKLVYVRDNSLDAYAGQDKGAVRFDCTGMEKVSEAIQEGGTVVRYNATGCSGPNATQPLATVRSRS